MTTVVQTESFQALDKDTMHDFIVEAARKGAFKRWRIQKMSILPLL